MPGVRYQVSGVREPLHTWKYIQAAGCSPWGLVATIPRLSWPTWRGEEEEEENENEKEKEEEEMEVVMEEHLTGISRARAADCWARTSLGVECKMEN